MKIVDAGEVFDPAPSGQESVWTKSLGWLVAVGLAAAALGGFILAVKAGEARVAMIIAREGGVAAWNEDDLWMLVGFVAMVVPFVTIPGAFGTRFRQLLPAMPRHRWKVVLGLLVAQTLAMGLVGFHAGQDGGFATVREAGWFRGGRIVERVPLTAARMVRTRCVMTYAKGDDRSKLATTPMLDYTVEFPRASGKVSYARMDWSVQRRRETLVPWVERMTLADAAFRAAGVKRRAELEPACLLGVMDGDPAAAEALGRLMR